MLYTGCLRYRKPVDVSSLPLEPLCGLQKLLQEEVDVTLEDLEVAAAKGGCRELIMRFKQQSAVAKQNSERSTARGYLVDNQEIASERYKAFVRQAPLKLTTRRCVMAFGSQL